MKPVPPRKKNYPTQSFTDSAQADTVSENMSTNSDTHREELLNVLENILEKIGVGKYQLTAFFTTGIASALDGGNMVVLAILNYLFIFESNLSESQAAQIATINALGLIFGAICAGYLVDTYGRAKIFRIGMLFILIPLLGAGLSNDFTTLVVFEGLFGFTNVLNLSSSIVYQQEISPKYFRAKSFIFFSGLSYTTGQIASLAIAQSLNVEDEHSNGKRVMILWMCVPAVIGGLIAIFKLKETPRFLLEFDYKEAIGVFKCMFKTNHNQELELSVTEKKKIKEWSAIQKKVQAESSYKILFDPNVRPTYFCLSILCFCNFLLFFSILYILPLALGQNEKGGFKFNQLYLLAAIEVPATVISGIVVEQPKFGRKNSLIFCLSAVSITLLGLIFTSNTVAFLLLAKLFATISQNILVPFIAESFNTKIRGTGMTAVTLFGCLSQVVYPQLVAKLFTSQRAFYFVILICFVIIAILSVHLLPHDTRGKPLDIHPSQIEKKIENEIVDEKDWLLTEEQESRGVEEVVLD